MLASLVSMMVVLAFGIGLVPSFDSARTNAASNDSGSIWPVPRHDPAQQGGALIDKGVGVTLESTPFSSGDTILVRRRAPAMWKCC